MAVQDAEYWIRRLGLIAHPEGGYYKETYRSPLWFSEDCLQPDYDGSRDASTAIYFLVTAGNPSKFHRLGTDEIWHHYAGDPLELLFLDLHGNLTSKWLGKADSAECMPQVLAPSGYWFAARVATGYALCGCTMAPGFDFQDFELATRKDMTFAYPAHTELFKSLTPEP